MERVMAGNSNFHYMQDPSQESKLGPNGPENKMVTKRPTGQPINFHENYCS